MPAPLVSGGYNPPVESLAEAPPRSEVWGWALLAPAESPFYASHIEFRGRLSVGNLLMSQEFRPSPGRCVGEIVCRTFASAMPSSGRLSTEHRQLPVARIGVAIGNHVAPSDVRAEASSRTRVGPRSSGFQSSCKTCAGVLPSSCFRGRRNQPLIPMSLYPPARSPTVSAR